MSVASTIDRRLRRTLPRPAYQVAVGRYYGLTRAVGRSPGRGRLLPDFLIIGAAKAGTTSLYGWLCEHPFVAPASQKEVHFFDYNHYRGLNWYRRYFPLERDRAAFAAEHGRPFITGEASPPYISHQWAPVRAARTVPKAKLLVTLRNPVDRAYSQYQMSRREDEEPLESFLDAVEAEDQRLAPELEHVCRDRRYNSWPIGCWSYLLRSRYVEGLERWLGLFPREQLHVLTLEQMAVDPQRTMDGVHEFLGLPPHTYSGLKPLHTASYDAISSEARARLSDYFRPYNERLYELLGADLGVAVTSAPVVFITGAARGLGRATALAFADAGASLALSDLCEQIPEVPYPLATRAQLEETARRCESAGSRVRYRSVDVRDQAQIDQAVADCRDTLGAVDVLINNAGLVGPAGAPAHQLDERAWSTVVDVDLTGAWRCAKAVLPDMVDRRAGVIINVASTAGMVAFPFFANYVAAKHGLIGLTRALALDYAPHGVRVNAVCPTSIEDEPELDSAMLAGVAGMLGVELEDYESLSLPHHPQGTLVRAREVAAAITWLASDGAARITGAVVPVDGGFTVR